VLGARGIAMRETVMEVQPISEPFNWDRTGFIEAVPIPRTLVGATGNSSAGDGENGNFSGSLSSGASHAGSGGHGYFVGSLLHTSLGLYDPINLAIAGNNASAHADQTNAVEFNQAGIQIGGIGGDAGNGNAASVGTPGIFAADLGIGSDTIVTGSGSAGNGGDGYCFGSLVQAALTLYDPINIAIAGSHSRSVADQENNLAVNQTAVQLSGVGGHGGSDNAAVGTEWELTGSDANSSGAHSAGNGGNGHFAGSLVDLSIAIFAPINIAVAADNSDAEARQSNTVHFDQSATEIVGSGGAGGEANLALVEALALHPPLDQHLQVHSG
jgi:hypothetical protein